jgi:hypothetical protein
METNSYGNLIKLIKALAGVTTFTDAELTNISHLINRRYREAYNTSQSWPRYLAQSEEREIAALKVSGASSVTNINQNYKIIGQDAAGFNVYRGLTNTTFVIYRTTDTERWEVNEGASVNTSTFAVSGGTQRAIETDNPGDSSFPYEVDAYSTETSLKVVERNLIPYSQTGETDISEFIKIHRKKAFVNQSRLEYDFFIDEDGANILNLAATTDNNAFVTFKKKLTPFSVSASWESSSVEVPIEFFYYIAHAVYADVLRLESKYDDAQKEEAFASQYLAQELEKIDIIANNNNLKKKFSTHLNRNSR